MYLGMQKVFIKTTGFFYSLSKCFDFLGLFF